MEGQLNKQQQIRVTQSGCAKGCSNDRFKVLTAAAATKPIASFTGKPSNLVERSKSLLQFKDKGIFKRIEEMTEQALINKMKIKQFSENQQSSLRKQVHSKEHASQQQQKQKSQQEPVVVVAMQFDQVPIHQASKASMQNSNKQATQESHRQQENKQISDTFQTPIKKSKQTISNNNKNSPTTNNAQHDWKQYYFQGSSSSSSYQKQKRLISTGILSQYQKDNEDEKSSNTKSKAKMHECQINSQDTTSPQSLYYPIQSAQQVVVTRPLHTPSKYSSEQKHTIQQQQQQNQEKDKQHHQNGFHQKQSQFSKENNQLQSPQQKYYQYSPFPSSSSTAAAAPPQTKKFSRSVSQEHIQQSNGSKADQQQQQQHPLRHHRRNLSDSMNFILLNKQSAPYSMKTKVDDRFLLFKKAVEYNLSVSGQNPNGKQDLDMIFEKSMLNTYQKNIGACDQASVQSRAKFKSTYQQL